MTLNKSRFITFVPVRPDDIDMNNHVHSSRYMDYVLAARFDQMERCYGFGMNQFVSMGYSWVMTSCQMNFKRPLNLGDVAEVTTWIEAFEKGHVEVHFRMTRQSSGKLACDGWFKYTMINISDGRAADIPEDIIQKYSI
jgi:YbgC/YbaW family acyl-CoA thioester hydrolase